MEEINKLSKQTSKNVLRQLMHSLNYRKNIGSFIYNAFKIYPQSDSMAAFHYVLTKAGIENIGVSLSLDSLEKDVRLPVIAHLTYNGGIFVIIKQMNTKNIILAGYGKDISINRKIFTTYFTGNCIIINTEAQLNINWKVYTRWFILELSKKILLPLIFFLLISIIFISGFKTIKEISFLLMHFLGLIVCVLMFIEQLGIDSKITNAICNGHSDNLDCNSILRSEGGKLLGIISWSEIGIVYFTVLLINVLLWGFESMWFLLAVISFLTFPYIFYSIYYQWRIAKIWCPLCLIIQAIFFSQTLLSVNVLMNKESNIDIKVSFFFVIIGITIAVVWFILQPMIENIIKYSYLRIEYSKFKHQSWLHQILMSEKKFDTTNVGQIYLLGERTDFITFVFNPLCGPCVNKLEKLLDVVDKFNVGLKIVFCSKEAYNGEDIVIIKYFIEQYLISSSALINSLKKYAGNYSIMRLRLSKHGINSGFHKEAESIILLHQQWYTSNAFIGTPIILWNDIKLPSYYTLEDLEIIISQH